VRGPVCILAAAGSGKTTTITRRIAYQVACGAFASGEILAVTFTEKAATELRERLRSLGVAGVKARTFHATALAQLTHLVPGVGAILPSKAPLLAPIVSRLHRAYRFRPLAEFATEIEWAKNRRLSPDAYADELGSHVPPVPPDVAVRVYRAYEREKARAGRIDFEDVLELLVRFYESSPDAIERFRSRCRAITVDEYQDVNLLQQSLLDLWLGERDELCAVGDDYQAIYSFTGATPRYLLELPARFPHATVVRLEENYRSTPEILSLANRLVPGLGGAEKTLRATRAAGPPPRLVPAPSPQAEAEGIVERVRELSQTGMPLEEMAVLVRVNARSEDLEGPLAAAGIPYQVRGGAFLDRPAARAVLRALRRAAEAEAAEAVREAALAAGLAEDVPEGIGDEGLTFQEDLRRLVALAGAFSGPVAAFVADLDARFRSDGDGRGVQLLTYHRAKGLEFEAVFLPFLQEGELPSRQAKTDEALAEERRLLYVGLTRARTELMLSWSTGRAPSRFLHELGVERASPGAGTRPRSRGDGGPADGDPAFAALRAWRRERSRADGVPAYVVFDDKTLAAIAAARPASPAALAAIRGVGPAKLARYADEVIALLAAL
jgi:DNA helicase-2/ATP-dependent DNA helicase PcrA